MQRRRDRRVGLSALVLVLEGRLRVLGRLRTVVCTHDVEGQVLLERHRVQLSRIPFPETISDVVRLPRRDQRHPLAHRLVVDAHHLGELGTGLLGQCEVGTLPFGHPPVALGPPQGRIGDADAGPLTVELLEPPAREDVEDRPDRSQLNIGAQV